MLRRDPESLAGIPEARLPDNLRRHLPASAPPAPWTCSYEAVVWWRRADRRARESLRHALPEAGRAEHGIGCATPLVSVGALVRYLDSPVGPYSEVLGCVGWLGRGRAGVHVPFIAVDSLPSIVGGRANWGLPKTLAAFEPAPWAAAAGGAEADDWRIRVSWSHRRPAPVGVRGPLRVGGPLRQRGPDGAIWTAPLRLRGTARIVRVAVDVSGEPTLTGWFPSGRCWGLLITAGTLTLGAAIVAPRSATGLGDDPR